MTTEEIKNYNKLCAEFLDWIYVPSNKLLDEKYKNINQSGWYSKIPPLKATKVFINYYKGRTVKDLKFHLDWNLIIDVVEAIEKLGYYIRFYKETCKIGNLDYLPLMENMDIIVNIDDINKKETVIKAINQFLIWYQNNK